MHQPQPDPLPYPLPSTSTEVPCTLCGDKTFKTVKLLNQHKIRFHKISRVVESKQYIICPLCEERAELTTHEALIQHIQDTHDISIEVTTLDFLSTEEFETWTKSEKIETSYAKHRSNQRKAHKAVYYHCNRSDIKGYTPKYQQYTEKAGGTIRIKGVCPSRIVCKFFNDGKVTVTFWKKHVGHDEKELRSKHLSSIEKEMIIKKLESGVPSSRILEDARKMEKTDLERINLLNSKDVAYLYRKHNIEKKRDKNEMVAAALKVQEWNAGGKNFAFFFKQEGEEHEILKKEDFALGFMNTTMEDKLRTFSNIICMDGTHGTNRRGMDLTVMLIKDDRNAGFPVAFFLTNRLDQVVQEVFLGALREKLQQDIRPAYFMSDDDPKYFNAWVKTMNNHPKRLLCTWHVVKNWNLQGKKKIKDLEIRKEMKNEMRKIITETDEDRMLEITNIYLLKLQEANETEFVNYLTRYYLQDEERIQMWAHCYRTNSGINTNMAIESLNNMLKTNQLRRKTHITIEKLLDTIEDLVDIKMWKRVLDIERPNANNYQDRVIIKAHKKAKKMQNKVEVTKESGDYGRFKVQSFNDSKIYTVCLRQVCERDCRTLYCRVCKICIHRYECNCPEYMVKNTLCKHVHLVRIYEERMGANSVADDFSKTLGEISTIKAQNEEEICQFIEERRIREIISNEEPLQDRDKRNIQLKYYLNWAEDLDDEEFNIVINQLQLTKKQIDEKRCTASKKRKMDKQEYFPSKKRSKVREF